MDPREAAGRRVLIFGSEETLRRLLALNLERRGYRVWVGTLAQIDAAETPDLILVDLGERGWEGAMERVRSRFAGVPVILLSPVWISTRKLERYAPACVLTKPFSLEALMRLTRSFGFGEQGEEVRPPGDPEEIPDGTDRTDEGAGEEAGP